MLEQFRQSSTIKMYSAAWMHNGFEVVRIDEEKGEAMETYIKHGSLAQAQTGCREGNYLRMLSIAAMQLPFLQIQMPEKEFFLMNMATSSD